MSYEAQGSGPLFRSGSATALGSGEHASAKSSGHALARTWRFINLAGPFLGLFLVVGLFSLSPSVRPYFLTGPNFKIILTQTVIVAMGTLGMTLIIVSGGIDLSVGSVVALASVVGASALVKGSAPWLVVLLCTAVGAGVGLINGLVIGGLRMMPFIVTLGMMGVARGTAKWLSGNQTISVPDSAINGIMDLKDPTVLFPLPLGVWITLGLAV